MSYLLFVVVSSLVSREGQLENIVKVYGRFWSNRQILNCSWSKHSLCYAFVEDYTAAISLHQNSLHPDALMQKYLR